MSSSPLEILCPRARAMAIRVVHRAALRVGHRSAWLSRGPLVVLSSGATRKCPPAASWPADRLLCLLFGGAFARNRQQHFALTRPHFRLLRFLFGLNCCIRGFGREAAFQCVN